MKNEFKVLQELIAFVAFVVVSLNMNGCTKVESPSLYNPDLGNGPQPVVDSLSPSGSALAGIDTLVIYGKNFSADKDSIGVDFLIHGKLAAAVDNKTGDNNIISASATRLVLKAPAVSGDTVKVMVWTLASADFSPMYNYKLVAAISPFSKLGSGESMYGLCVSPDDSLYASISNVNLATKDEGIFEISPTTGTRASSPYALPTSGNIGWLDLKFGPSGYLYATKAARAVYRFSQGTTGSVWANVTGASFSGGMDFDPNHNMWLGGNNQYIYKISSTDLLIATVTNVSKYPFSGNIRSMRYYNGYLYFAASVSSSPTSKVFRAPIVNDTLGTPAVYFDLANDPTGGSNIYAITFSSDGDMYAGTDSSDYLIVVHPGGTFDRPFSLYVASKVLNSSPKSFAWIGTNLYASTTAGTLLKIVARKQSAPYYGIQ